MEQNTNLSQWGQFWRSTQSAPQKLTEKNETQNGTNAQEAGSALNSIILATNAVAVQDDNCSCNFFENGKCEQVKSFTIQAGMSATIINGPQSLVTGVVVFKIDMTCLNVKKILTFDLLIKKNDPIFPFISVIKYKCPNGIVNLPIQQFQSALGPSIFFLYYYEEDFLYIQFNISLPIISVNNAFTIATTTVPFQFTYIEDC